MHILLYDALNSFAEVEVPVGISTTYDIPDSGTVHDYKGRTFNISSRTDYGIWKITTFEGVGTEKVTTLGDFEKTMQSLISNFKVNGTFTGLFHTPDGHWQWTKSNTTNNNPQIDTRRNAINTIDSYLKPGTGTANNAMVTDNNPPYVYNAGYMMYYTGDDSDANEGWIFGYWWVQTITSGHTTIRLVRCTNMTGANFTKPIAEPGEEGFKPIGYTTEKTTGGGDHSNKIPEYKTDLLNPPGEPDESEASLVGSGFVNAYMVTSGNLENFGACLFSSTLLTAIANLFVNPLDAVISLNVFPCKPRIGTNTPIRLLNHVCTQGDLGIDANGFTLAKQFRTFDFGSITIAEEWESFLDYEGTNATIYLPFIGEIDIPITEIMGATVNVQYTVDFFTGMCVATVTSTRNIQLSRVLTAQHRSIHSYTGNISINVPLSAVNYGNIVGSFISAASSGLRSGAAGALVSLASDAAGGGFKPSITTKGTVSANAGFCAILYPYIEIERPITAEPEGFQEVIGYPSYIKNTIGDYQGLCICDEIDLRGVTGATENEIRRIRQLCREGVRN